VVRLYADEQFPLGVTKLLRSMEHDVLTVQEVGKGGLSDEEVLFYAMRESRIILTLDRRDFFRLHKLQPEHSGIIACKNDSDTERMALRIDEVISANDSLVGKFIKVNRSAQG
jgi:predicted nuclease of predicted toxin-antitoxin system